MGIQLSVNNIKDDPNHLNTLRYIYAYNSNDLNCSTPYGVVLNSANVDQTSSGEVDYVYFSDTSKTEFSSSNTSIPRYKRGLFRFIPYDDDDYSITIYSADMNYKLYINGNGKLCYRPNMYDFSIKNDELIYFIPDSYKNNEGCKAMAFTTLYKYADRYYVLSNPDFPIIDNYLSTQDILIRSGQIKLSPGIKFKNSKNIWEQCQGIYPESQVRTNEGLTVKLSNTDHLRPDKCAGFPLNKGNIGYNLESGMINQADSTINPTNRIVTLYDEPDFKGNKLYTFPSQGEIVLQDTMMNGQRLGWGDRVDSVKMDDRELNCRRIFDVLGDTANKNTFNLYSEDDKILLFNSLTGLQNDKKSSLYTNDLNCRDLGRINKYLSADPSMKQLFINDIAEQSNIRDHIPTLIPDTVTNTNYSSVFGLDKNTQDNKASFSYLMQTYCSIGDNLEKPFCNAIANNTSLVDPDILKSVYKDYCKGDNLKSDACKRFCKANGGDCADALRSFCGEDPLKFKSSDTKNLCACFMNDKFYREQICDPLLKTQGITIPDTLRSTLNASCSTCMVQECTSNDSVKTSTNPSTCNLSFCLSGTNIINKGSIKDSIINIETDQKCGINYSESCSLKYGPCNIDRYDSNKNEYICTVELIEAIPVNNKSSCYAQIGEKIDCLKFKITKDECIDPDRIIDIEFTYTASLVKEEDKRNALLQYYSSGKWLKPPIGNEYVPQIVIKGSTAQIKSRCNNCRYEQVVGDCLLNPSTNTYRKTTRYVKTTDAKNNGTCNIPAETSETCDPVRDCKLDSAFILSDCINNRITSSYKIINESKDGGKDCLQILRENFSENVKTYNPSYSKKDGYAVIESDCRNCDLKVEKQGACNSNPDSRRYEQKYINNIINPFNNGKSCTSEQISKRGLITIEQCGDDYDCLLDDPTIEQCSGGKKTYTFNIKSKESGNGKKCIDKAKTIDNNLTLVSQSIDKLVCQLPCSSINYGLIIGIGIFIAIIIAIIYFM